MGLLDTMGKIMLTFVVFFLILSILVIIHELGHYWVAKKNGIYVEEFGFGLPPRLFGIKIGETIYSWNWLPFGGFVRLYGEDAEGEGEYMVDGKIIPKKRAFYAQKPWRKASVIVAGVVMNIILAVVLFAGAYSFTGIPQLTDRVQVIDITESSPAKNAGLMAQDVIKAISPEGGETVMINSVKEFVDVVGANKGKQIMVDVVRKVDDGEVETMVSVIPRVDPPAGEGSLGVVVSQEVINKFYPWWQMPFLGAWEGMKEAFAWAVMIIQMLGMMVMTILRGNVPEGVAGPVGIYQVTGDVVNYGWLAVVRFLGVLSLNLAVMNILPLPALDGGRLWFVIYEAITGKRVKPAWERRIHGVGMILLLSLIVLVTVSDVARLFSFDLQRIF